MGKRESYEAKTTELIQPVVEANGVELFDVDYVKEGSDWYLRAYIDKEGGIAVERHHSHAPFNLVVVRADAGIMQEAAQFLPVVEPEDHSLADRASFPSQIPAPIPLDSVLFRERHHDLIDAVHQRSTVLSAEAQDAFELLLTAFSFLPVFRFFPAVELAQGCKRHVQQVLRRVFFKTACR